MFIQHQQERQLVCISRQPALQVLMFCHVMIRQSVLNPFVLMSSVRNEPSADSFVSAASSQSANTRVDGQELPAISVSSHEY